MCSKTGKQAYPRKASRDFSRSRRLDGCTTLIRCTLELDTESAIVAGPRAVALPKSWKQFANRWEAKTSAMHSSLFRQQVDTWKRIFRSHWKLENDHLSFYSRSTNGTDIHVQNKNKDKMPFSMILSYFVQLKHCFECVGSFSECYVTSSALHYMHLNSGKKKNSF